LLKGPKCTSEKCPFAKRPYAPGVHGRRRSRKPSYYSLQLREKQKAKMMYGMLERQFRRFFELASKSKGVTGRMLIQLLERRLDNVVYRALFALSREEARQTVTHGFIWAGRRVAIPSYIVKEGEEFEFKAPDEVKKRIKENIEINSKERSVPGWLEVKKDTLSIKIVRLPEKEDLAISINEQLIVELYSK